MEDRVGGMLWLQYFTSKVLPKEFARGQLDIENILWRNNLGVSSVSDKTGEEESARVSEVSTRQRNWDKQGHICQAYLSEVGGIL